MVNRFKRYLKNRYLGQVGRHFVFGQKYFETNVCLKENYSIKFCENLGQIDQWIQEISKKQVSRSSRRHLVFGEMCFVTVLCIKERNCINLVKFWSKLVHWFKRYRKNKYLGQVAAILFLNKCVLQQFYA